MKEIISQLVYYNAIAFVVGFILDYFFGEPPVKIHPVVWIGKLIRLFENVFYPFRDKLFAGFLCVLSVLFIVLSFAFVVIMLFVMYRDYFFVRLFYSLVATYIFFSSISVKSLKEHALRVYKALENGDIQKARLYLSHMVSRDTDDLEEDKIIKSTVESVSENYVDGVLSVMFYFSLFGIVGALIFKTINTFDSMIGYKNEQYIEFGRFAAKFDDVLNFIPARLSIVFIAIASVLIGRGFEAVIYTFGKYRKAHSSPNSAHPMSAFAGSLKLMLGGRTKYNGVWIDKPIIGEFDRKPKISDITLAVHLLEVSSFLSFIFFLFSTMPLAS
ncbi:cobalamin biosynthesis protein [Hippea alviniae]|uniref:cobalamin biosynthesis protein n=1 Tax=Hippea alviniae TaxID=1279027 RepID=UPI0003B59947|nr:cobalamin biosynthesis protein [Hippea alviniae]